MTLTAAPGRTRRRRAPVDQLPTDPVTTYALDVVEGRVLAGELVRRACQRHLDDLRDGPARGLRWDAAEAQRIIDFFPLLRHYKGEWGPSEARPLGLPIVLAPWQAFVVGMIFGWKRADGTRRFRTAYIEVAKKNGKTLMAAVLGVILAFFDDEPAAEVYSVATKRDQAKLSWADAKMLISKNPALSARIDQLALTLYARKSGSKFAPLGRDSDSDQGINVHASIVDELHVIADRSIVDNVNTAKAARRQPITIYITTAGVVGESIWAETRADVVRIIERRAEDDSIFGVVYTLDRDDDPLDEAVWVKANPNLGVSVSGDFLREQAAAARRSPGLMASFLRFHANVPTSVRTRALSIEEWDACSTRGDDESYAEWAERVAPAGAAGYGGLDLASVTDLTAFILPVKPADDETGPLRVIARFWCPEEGIAERSRVDGVPYEQWVRDGFLTATPGSVTDYAFVKAEVLGLAERYAIGEVGYDRWNATQLAVELGQEGAAMFAISQTSAGLGPAWRELEKLILDRGIDHGGHPILRWMAANVEAELDAAGNARPSKRNSSERIDGIVGLTMAVSRWMAYGGAPVVWTAA